MVAPEKEGEGLGRWKGERKRRREGGEKAFSGYVPLQVARAPVRVTSKTSRQHEWGLAGLKKKGYKIGKSWETRRECSNTLYETLKELFRMRDKK